MARNGKAWHGKERYDKSCTTWDSKTRHGMTWNVKARHGKECKGMTRHGKACSGNT